jgi:CheY-like chemotaxis protein
MKIVIVENEATPREGFRMHVRSLGFEDVLVFDNVETAMKGLAGIEEPMIVLLDHDFGDGRSTGYTLCTWLRQTHPLGMILPIVYLTGRLAPDHYLQHERELPFEAPSVYVAKAHADEHLGALLERFTQQFERIREHLDDQSARRALAILAQGDLPDWEESEGSA